MTPTTTPTQPTILTKAEVLSEDGFSARADETLVSPRWRLGQCRCVSRMDSRNQTVHWTGYAWVVNPFYARRYAPLGAYLAAKRVGGIVTRFYEGKGGNHVLRRD